MHKGAEPRAGGHKHKRTGRPTPQRMKTAIRRWSLGVQRSGVVARSREAVERRWGRRGGGIVVRPFQEVNSSYPTGAPALFRVHVTEGGTG